MSLFPIALLVRDFLRIDFFQQQSTAWCVYELCCKKSTRDGARENEQWKCYQSENLLQCRFGETLSKYKREHSGVKIVEWDRETERMCARDAVLCFWRGNPNLSLSLGFSIALDNGMRVGKNCNHCSANRFSMWLEGWRVKDMSRWANSAYKKRNIPRERRLC